MKQSHWLSRGLQKKTLPRVLLLSVSGALVLIGIFFAATYFARQGSDAQNIASSDIVKTTEKEDLKTQNTTEAVPVATAEESAPASGSQPSESKPIESRPTKSTTQKSGSAPTAYTPPPFAVTSVYLSSATAYCNPGDSYYVVQIGDVNIGLSNNTGGQIVYGFEAKGRLPDASYRYTGTVAAGSMSTSFVKMYRGSSDAPYMIYSQVAYAGPAPTMVRAVVYSPNVVYSQWLSVPAMEFGQTC